MRAPHVIRSHLHLARHLVPLGLLSLATAGAGGCQRSPSGAAPPASAPAASQAAPPGSAPRAAGGFSGLKLTTEHEGGPPVVHSVFDNTPAALAGLREGDILVEVGGHAVADVPAAIAAIGAHAPGDTVSFRIRQQDKELAVALTLIERPAEVQIASQPAPPSFEPLVRVRDDDYSTARAQFKTTLTRRVPSPQEWAPITPPADVNEIEFQSGELRLKAWVSRPNDPARKHPAVLFLHGGFAFGYPDDWDVSRPYRDAGLVVMTPLLRGENGQPGAFSFLYDETDDALAAAETLSRLPYVDAQHIYLAGPSAGGTVALLAAMASPRFRAVASFSATPDQALFCQHARNAARDIPFDITDLRELEMRSPLAFAASLKCPARLFVGTQEPEFQATNRRLAALAHEHGIDAEFELTEGDHETSVAPGIRKSIDFFLQH